MLLKKLLLSPAGNRRYFINDCLILKIGGVSLTGDEGISYKVYSLVLIFVIYVAYPILAFKNVFTNHIYNDPEAIAFYGGSIMVLIFVMVILPKRIQLGKVLRKLEMEPFTADMERGGEEEVQLIDKWATFEKNLDWLFLFATIFCIVPQNCFSIYKRLNYNDSREWRFPYGALNFVNMTYSPNFEIAWAYQSIHECFVINITRAVLIIITGTITFICTQFRMLQCYLQNSKNLPSDDDYQRFLKKAVTYHIQILELSRELEDVLGNLILASHASTLPMICFLVYFSTTIPMSDVRMPRIALEILTATFIPFILCFCNEQLAEECQNVGKAAYNVDFVGTNVGLQKGLMLILKRSVRPIRIRAGKVIESSLGVTFVSILKASYSAFTLLKRMNSSEV